MATQKQIETWLTFLKDTPNFESAAHTVFERIVAGEGHGLMILQGPPEIANKSFFLKMVKAFQKGVPPAAAAYFSADVQRLLAQVDVSHFECIDLKEDCPMDASHLHTTPFYLTLPLALAAASHKHGLKKGNNIVVLCDDLQQFLRHNESEQVLFLQQLAATTDQHGEMTFIGANTFPGFKNLESTKLAPFVLRLGYD